MLVKSQRGNGGREIKPTIADVGDDAPTTPALEVPAADDLSERSDRCAAWASAAKENTSALLKAAGIAWAKMGIAVGDTAPVRL